MLKLCSSHTICCNSDMFRSILVIPGELLNISKIYIKTDGLLKTLKFVHKMSADVKFICSSAKLVQKMQSLYF